MTRPFRVLSIGYDPDDSAESSPLLERESERIVADVAARASAGIELIGENRYDCVVSEYDLPDGNGIEVLERVREQFPDLPFVLVTTESDENVTGDAVVAGATDYFRQTPDTKRVALLANRIETVAGKFRAERRAARKERTLSLLSDINQTFTNATTRDEIAREITERFAATDTYQVAWTGEYDSECDRIVPQTVAGVEEASIRPTAIETESTSDAGVLEAIHRGVISVVHERVPTLDVWTEASPAVPYDAVTVVPIVYSGKRYGFLALHADETDAIGATERGVLEDVGDYVGSAFHVAEIRQTLERHRTVVEAVPEGAFLLDENATIDLVNESAADLVDRSREHLNGRSFPMLVEDGIFEEAIVDWYLESVREMLSSSSDRTQASFETEIHPVESDPRIVEINLTLRPSDGEYAGTVGVVRDITDRKRRESAIRDSERRFEAVFQNPMTLIGRIAPDGTVLEVNQMALDLIDASAEDVTDEKFWETAWWNHSTELQSALREWIRRAAAGEHVRFEADHPTVDGDMTTVDGLLYPIRDDGEITELLAIARDISERKERERELRRQNERLEEFSSVVSHDLRNPLNVAMGELELAQRECDSEHLDSVERAHDRMEALVDDILTLAQNGDRVSGFEAVDLGSLVERCWRNVETAESTVIVQVDSTIRVDPSRAKQLLENLFRNAVEHGNESVQITVGPVGDTAGFYVADDGPGIPPSQRENVFETGFSTAEHGTGFGLSIVKRIAEAHGWSVDLTESESGGARFEFTGVDVKP